MFKALFVPQGFLTLAAIALLGYRQWTGEWPNLAVLTANVQQEQSLSWDRRDDIPLNEVELKQLKSEILEQLDRMETRSEKQ